MVSPENPIDLGKLSDGYHTFDELYEHRHVLFLALIKAHPEKSWFSGLHEDGTMFVGMFICGIELPTGMVAYHLPNGFLEAAEATGAKRLEFATAWDGHTSEDVVERIKGFILMAGPK